MESILSHASLPLYRCHKEVRAIKIQEVRPQRAPCGSWSGGAVIVPQDKSHQPFSVDQAYVEKHHPHPHGYFVVYSDGYESFSPAQAFEEGYSLIES